MILFLAGKVWQFKRAEESGDVAKFRKLKAMALAANDHEKDGEFFATDVFTDYTLEFLKQARAKKDQPWFLYLAHSAPHFPVQAPVKTIDKYMPTFRKGWDVLRGNRFKKQKQLGLVKADAVLPPRSQVPVDRDDIANGYSGKKNPALPTF